MVKDTLQSQFKLRMLIFRMLFLFSTLHTFSFLQAQQLPLFTQYREYSSSINPAAVSSGYLNFGQQGVVGLSYRSQWTDIASAPRTTVLHGSYFIDDLSGVNWILGGHVMNDQIGPTGFTSLNARVAAVISGDPAYGGISIGLNAGTKQFRINAGELRARDRDDITLAQNQSQFYPEVGIGVFAYKSFGRGDEDYIYGGFSVPQIPISQYTFTDDNGRELGIKQNLHTYAQFGLIKTFFDDSFIEPSVWVKYAPNVDLHIDANVRYQFAGGLWIGAGGSSAQTVHLEGGVLLGDNMSFENNLQIGYGYDYTFNSAGPFLGNVHELNLAYYFTR